MDELLSRVLDSHGGLPNWEEVDGLTAEMSLGGPFWESLGWPGVYDDQTVVIDARREHITFSPFTAPDRTSVFQVAPERVEIRTSDGRVVESRENPRPGFPAFAPGVAWDAVQVAYFTSCATWNYLTAPFSFSYPGVTAHEIEPWDEDGQEWRRLAVSFPESMPNHNPDQVFYYDTDFMQQRMDYLPEVTGILIAHYTPDRRTFDGFVFPTRRLIHPRDPSGTADQSFVPITIDVETVSVHRRA
jgi:hypothetical protein